MLRKRRISLWIRTSFMTLFATGCLLWGINKISPEYKSRDVWSIHSGYQGRNLLAIKNESNCTPAAIEQFPRPLMGQEVRKNGAIIIHCLVTLYMFIAIAIVCDIYFVPSLECICERLKLSSDVAGATFMAAGSSAPELSTTIIGVFIAKDDIGLGAVVGSAVFNIMFVISCCALFAGAVVYLNWWPLFRDCFFYMVSIIALILIIYDEEVHWYEAFILLILYVIYIIVMIFNSRLESWALAKVTFCSRSTLDPQPTQAGSGYELLGGKIGQGPVPPEHTVTDSDSDPTARHITAPNITTTEIPKKEPKPEEESPFKMPEGRFHRLWWGTIVPLRACFYFTIPDCRKESCQKWFIITFLMSMIWIALLSYIMVWMIAIVGYTFGIPDTIMGLTFIAAGISVPDVIASVIVVRENLGDMAVSNAVGSNVFDILLCLGIPWFFQTIRGGSNSSIEVKSEGLTYSTITLLSTVVFLIVAVHMNGWKLNKRFGVILMVVYFMFMVLACLYELNLFGFQNKPECPSNY